MTDKAKVTSGILTLMVLLGVADAALLEGMPAEANVVAEKREQRPTEPQEPEPTRPPEGGVRKATGPNVLETLVAQGFTFNDTKERVIVTSIVKDTENVQTKVMLNDGDRAGTISWITSPNVKKHYISLKEALHRAFTPEVTDLLDETQRRENRPTRNLLTFLDPGLSSERVVFVRVRERLYEFHIAEGASEAIFNLIEELTQ